MREQAVRRPVARPSVHATIELPVCGLLRAEKRRLVRAGAVVAVVLLVAGCNGGVVDRHALSNDAATIDSINCEAWLLSDAAARGRVTSQFTGEQAEELGIQASNLADALARRPTAAGLESRVRKKARDAAMVARRLNADPSDRSVAALLAVRFKAAGTCT
jgi:hypothetical protein